MIRQWARKALAAMKQGAEAGDMAEVKRRLEAFEEALGDYRANMNQTIAAIKSHLDRKEIFKPDIVNDVDRLAELMPPYNYGEIPAGTEFIIEPCPVLMIKRKDGVEVSTLTGRLCHFAGAQVIQPINY